MTVHTRRLRQKIETDPERPRYLQTVCWATDTGSCHDPAPYGAESQWRSAAPRWPPPSGAVYGASAGWGVLEMLVPLGLLTVGCAELLLARRARLGGPRRQLTLGGAIVVGQLLIAVALFVRVMFVSAHDALLTALVVLYAGAVGLWAARSQARGMLDDIGHLRGGLQAVADGSRSVSIVTHGGDELAAVAGDIERMVAALAVEEQARTSAERAHRDLIAAVSHDLRTPITALALLSDVLKDRLVDDATRDDYVVRISLHPHVVGDDRRPVRAVAAAGRRGALEPGTGALERTSVRVDRAMRPEADAVSVAVSAELSDGLAHARANPEQIQRVLFNLIHNAIRHTPADGSITVRAEGVARRRRDRGGRHRVGHRRRRSRTGVRPVLPGHQSAGAAAGQRRAGPGHLTRDRGGRTAVASGCPRRQWARASASACRPPRDRGSADAVS